MTWKMPTFNNGVRVVPYYAGVSSRAWRVDIGRPLNGFDVTCDELADDACMAEKLRPFPGIDAGMVRRRCAA